MAGRMGNKKVTKQNLKVIDVDSENNILMVKGSVQVKFNWPKDSVKTKMKISVLNLKNKSVGDIDLDPNIFGVKTFPDLIHNTLGIKMQSLGKVHKTKNRSEVSGRIKNLFHKKELVS